MPRFTVGIVETVERVAHLVIDALDEDAAVSLARDLAPKLNYGLEGEGNSSYHIHDVGMSMEQDPEDTHISTHIDMDPGLWEETCDE